MPKDRDDQLNKGHPDGEAFSLEEILAEYKGRGGGEEMDNTIPLPVIPQKDLPRPHRPPRREGAIDNVVDFLGKAAPRQPAPQEPEAGDGAPGAVSPPSARNKPRPTPSEGKAPDEKVVDFPGEEETASAPPDGPEEESPLQAGINKLRRKADDYAEHMFEEEGVEDDEDVRKAEKYLPGVDSEDVDAPMRRRRSRRALPPAPDLPPADLYKRYNRGLSFLRLRGVLVLLLALPLLYLTLAPFFKFPLPGPLGESYELRVYTLAGMLGCAMLLGVDTFLAGLLRIFQLGIGMDTLVSLACAATLALSLIHI